MLFVLLVTGCGVRQTRNMLSSGNYDGAINQAINNLRSNKDAKGRQDYVYLLEEAFAKAKERDLRNINLWAKGANPANLERIYETYVQLNNRQEKIRPLLPLRLQKQGRNAIFPFDDYTDQIIDSKNALSKYLYEEAKSLLKTNQKISARQAFDDLNYLNSINPGYKDVRALIEEAQFKGTDFVHVNTKNETNVIIPTRLLDDLLDFSTYGLNDKWTVFHSNRVQNINYDYGLIVNFREIHVSPEQIRERQFVKEKLVKDGVKNAVDQNGNVVKDSLGNPIKIDNMVTAKINIYEFSQFKSCQVVAKIDYIDFNTNQLIDTYPLASEFIFEHIYATFNGDKRAADEDYMIFFNRRSVPFPSHEQMIFDTGEDLKLKLKNIITRNRFRR